MALRFMTVVTLVLLISACAPIRQHHGFVPFEEDLEALRIGVTTQTEVVETIGPPGITGLSRDNTLYYVASERRVIGPFAPREVYREVVALSFDSADRLRNIEHFGLEDGRVVVLSRRVTDAPTVNISVIEQLLGNVGRFDPGAILN